MTFNFNDPKSMTTAVQSGHISIVLASSSPRQDMLPLHPRFRFALFPAFTDLSEGCQLYTYDQESEAPTELLGSVDVEVRMLG